MGINTRLCAPDMRFRWPATFIKKDCTAYENLD
jgi:hypothetical protein